MIYKGENPNKSILAIAFDRINILTSGLLLCATFFMLFCDDGEVHSVA